MVCEAFITGLTSMRRDAYLYGLQIIISQVVDLIRIPAKILRLRAMDLHFTEAIILDTVFSKGYARFATLIATHGDGVYQGPTDMLTKQSQPRAWATSAAIAIRMYTQQGDVSICL